MRGALRPVGLCSYTLSGQSTLRSNLPLTNTMWKLTIEDDEGTKTLLPLVRDEYHIGRDEKNTIRLTERNISRRHASLKKNGDTAWHVIDHESYNGCYVNGQRVAGHHKLAHADIIQLGDYRIFITNDAVDAEATGPNQAVPPSAVPVQEKPDRLVMVAGPDVGSEYPLLQNGLVTLGRAEECTVSINHPSVSRVHAEIRFGNGRYEISDKGSSNGIRINTNDFKRALLEHGDLIELGDVRLRYIERGQIYRPMAGMTMQLSAITGREMLPSTADAPPSKKGFVVGAVVAGVLVLSGIVGVSMSGNAENPDKGAAAADDASKAAFEAAKKASSVGAHDDAIARLADIPASSSLRQDPAFAAIHTKWGEWAIAKASELVDKSDKRALLTKVAQHTSVDNATRKKASDALSALEAGSGTDINNLPQAKGTTPDSTAVDPGNKPPPPTTAGAGTVAKKDPQTPAPDKKDPPPPSTAGTPDATDGKDAEMKTRRLLENKMNSGKATKDDLRMLKAICQHQSDSACKNRATEAMKKLP